MPRSPFATLSLPAFALSRADGAALLTVVFWGLNNSVFKLVMGDISPMAAVSLETLLSSLVFVVILKATGQWRLPARRDVPAVVGIGLFGMALSMSMFAEGLQRTTATHVGLLSTITPLLVYGVSHVLGLLRMTARDVAGLGIGLLGAALIVGAPLLLGTEPGGASLLGDALALGCSAVWGLWAIAAMPLLRRYGTLRSLAWFTMIAAVGTAPLGLPDLVGHAWSGVGWEMLAGLAYIGVVAGALASVLWYGAVRQVGAARTMVYANVQPVFVVVFAALLLGERVEGTALAGGLLVLAGVLLTRSGKAGERPAADAREAALPRYDEQGA